MYYNKHQLSFFVGCALIGLVGVGTGHAANFVTKASVGSGNSWNNQTVWSNPPNVAVSLPVAGNTYELIANGVAFGNNTANTRMRNPATDGLQTFPGDSLTMNTNTDIRFKKGAAGGAISGTICNFPGVGGNPGLILNGGALVAADNIIFVVTGRVQVASQSILSGGDNGGGSQQITRGIYLRGVLSGGGNLVIIQSDPGTPHQTDADGSGYTGTWIVQDGFLKGLAPTSLGVGNIIVAPTNQLAAAVGTNFSKVEFMYDWNTTGSLTLSNNPVSGSVAICLLHQNVTVGALIVNGTSLPFGTYTWASLNTSYPANFPSGGSGQINIVPPTPPPAPVNGNGVGGDGQVSLTWSAAANAQGYLIKRSDTDGGPYTIINSTAGTGFVDSGLINGNTYYYVIAATNSLGSSPDSAQIVGRPNVVVTGITAAGGTNQVTLNWNSLISADTYSVLRSSTPSGFTTLVSGLTSPTFLDTAVQSGRTYYYKVSASLSGGGTSAPSATVSGTTAPSTPTLTVVLFASTVIRLGWTVDPVVSNYFVERSSDGVNFSPVVTLGGTISSYTNSGLALNTTYTYRVRGSNAGGPSDFSNPATKATPIAGYNVNFQSGANASAGALNSPTPPGYLGDVGEVFADRGNGYSYGWTTLGGTNIVRDARWRQNAISPDLRYDTFLHMMKANVGNPAQSAVWEFVLPNGFYQVHIVGGDSDNADAAADKFQFAVEGVVTAAYTPSATPALAHWADFTVGCVVTDGRLTITSGPAALNNKITFVDIYPDTPVAPVISGQPQSQNVEEYRPATFSVTLSAGSTPLSYQWYRGTDPVPNGTNRILTLPRARTTDAGSYSVIVTNYGGSDTSMVATLTVFADTIAPAIASISSLDGLTIGLCFSEEVDNANMAVGDNFTYVINGDPHRNPDSVVIRADGRSVLLRLNSPVSGPLTIDVEGAITDLAGNVMQPAGSHAATVVGGFTAGDVGAPTFPGSHFTCDSNIIDIVGGGMDYWANSDQAYLLTRSVTGNFDAQVRVVGLAGSNAITKALLLARETLNPDSRGYHVSINPPPPGRDLIEMGMRDTVAGATAVVGSTYTPVGVPNGWMRLTRVGNTFTGYRSTNGINWVALGTNTPVTPYPATLSVGLGMTAHDNTLIATGSFSNLQISGLVGEQLSGGIYSGGTFTAGFPTRNGFTYIVEYKNTVDAAVWTQLGGPIAGDGTVKTFTDPGPVSPTTHRIYRVSFR
ncbi:MAG: hypothetical protein QOF48_1835 [Verrucomicrobiota bacterium]|jgi:hypothetical protein